MRIYTSSWSTRLPPTVLKVGISRGTPALHPGGYRRLRELQPGPWFRSLSPEAFHERYMAQLGHLDAAEIIAKVERMSEGRDVALVCFEAPDKPEAWCHRGQVSAWLHDQLGLEVYEFGMEEFGCGWQHPKLHVSVRR